MTLKRYKLTIEYDGAPFSGWQRQDGALSVQQVIEEAFFKFCGQDIRIHAAGRTDAGVHAAGQVAHGDLDYGDRALTGFDLSKALNAHLRDHPVSILMAEETAPDFHARFDAVSKTYLYRILSRPAPPAIDRGRVWHVRRPLDAAVMHQAAQALIGHHDFTTFRAVACQAKSPVRTLDELSVRRMENSDEIQIRARGRSFLHHQVRNMAGTLKLVGEGKWTVQDVAAALAARDRTKGGPTAPPEGLTLVEILYS